MILQANSENIKKAAELIQQSELVAFPTETVYGLGANALDEKAINKIFSLKKRPQTDPLIVHIHNLSQVFEFATLNQTQEKCLNKLAIFWPGPLSIILPKKNVIPDLVTSCGPNVALRIPNHHVALELLKTCNLPLAAPSANPFGYVSPTTAEHVYDSFINQSDQLKIILDGGQCQIGLESTVLSLSASDEVPTILRPGAITFETLSNLLGEVRISNKTAKLQDNQQSPGQLEQHYSPHTKLVFKDNTKDINFKNAALISFGPQNSDFKKYKSVRILSDENNPNQIAHNLFCALRELDKLDFEVIVVDTCALRKTGMGLAILDRIGRAAAKR